MKIKVRRDTKTKADITNRLRRRKKENIGDLIPKV